MFHYRSLLPLGGGVGCRNCRRTSWAASNRRSSANGRILSQRAV